MFGSYSTIPSRILRWVLVGFDGRYVFHIDGKYLHFSRSQSEALAFNQYADAEREFSYHRSKLARIDAMVYTISETIDGIESREDEAVGMDAYEATGTSPARVGNPFGESG